MSKSKGNVVDPNQVVDELGADVLRVYILFMGDYGSAAPWSESSVKGCKRFLDRTFDLFEIAKGKGSTPELESLFHKTVKKVTNDIEEMKFNTAIASMMTLINKIYEVGHLTTDELKTFISILCPFAPHISEELWHMLGEKELLSLTAWPTYDEAKCQDASVEIVVQINGKIRDRFSVPTTASAPEVIALAKESEKISPLIDGKTVVKELYVPGKLVNIVVK